MDEGNTENNNQLSFDLPSVPVVLKPKTGFKSSGTFSAGDFKFLSNLNVWVTSVWIKLWIYPRVWLFGNLFANGKDRWRARWNIIFTLERTLHQGSYHYCNLMISLRIIILILYGLMVYSNIIISETSHVRREDQID